MNCCKSVFLITRNKYYNENDISDEKVEPYTNCSQCCHHPGVFFYSLLKGQTKWSNNLWKTII